HPVAESHTLSQLTTPVACINSLFRCYPFPTHIRNKSSGWLTFIDLFHILFESIQNSLYHSGMGCHLDLHPPVLYPVFRHLPAYFFYGFFSSTQDYLLGPVHRCDRQIFSDHPSHSLLVRSDADHSSFR